MVYTCAKSVEICDTTIHVVVRIITRTVVWIVLLIITHVVGHQSCCTHQGLQGQEHGIIPRPDDTHHTQGVALDAAPGHTSEDRHACRGGDVDDTDEDCVNGSAGGCGCCS